MNDNPKPQETARDAHPGFVEALGSTARCRWCDRNDRPLDAMANMSWKMSYGGYTGVCLECLNDPEAERRYHPRMLAQSNSALESPPNDPSSATGREQPPARLCCGQRHSGVVCPDGRVMCCLCFKRFAQDELNVASDGRKEDVCKECAEQDRRPTVESERQPPKGEMERK